MFKRLKWWILRRSQTFCDLEAELDDALDTIRKVVDEEASIDEVMIDKSGGTLKFSGKVVRGFAFAFKHLLGDAPNYVEFQMTTPDLPPGSRLLVTIQRSEGISPADKARKLEDLVSHCWVHSRYPDCGRDQMDSELRQLYDTTIERRIKSLDNDQFDIEQKISALNGE